MRRREAEAVSRLRAQVSDLFRADGDADREALSACLVPMSEAILELPLRPTAESRWRLEELSSVALSLMRISMVRISPTLAARGS